MTNCAVCGAPIAQPRKTLTSRVKKYCNKCRLEGVRNNFVGTAITPRYKKNGYK